MLQSLMVCPHLASFGLREQCRGCSPDAASHPVDVEDVAVGILEPDQFRAAGDVNIAFEPADVRIPASAFALSR
jgi:hypothetical protein